MVRVITISREFGSGGATLAQHLASRLRWSLVDDELVSEMASRARVSPAQAKACDETLDPWTRRLVRALWRGGFEGAVARSDAEREAFDAEQMAELWNQVILKSADTGECVVVGRGGQCLLNKRSDAFHVQVYAPLSERIRRIQARSPEIRDPQAAAFERDQMRAAYVRHHFGHDWTNRHLYHLTICSSIGMERTADAVLAAAGLLEHVAK